MKTISFAEALEIAVQIEDRGAAFYEEAAKNSADPQAMDVFFKLATLEKKHKGFFSGLATVPGRPARRSTDSQDAQELGILAEHALFNMKAGSAGLFHGREKSGEVINLALGFEKDSVIFYLSLKEEIADPKEAAQLDTIIREELRHITILHELRAKLLH